MVGLIAIIAGVVLISAGFAVSMEENEPGVITFSGRGQEATPKFSLERGLTIFRMTHTGDANL